MEDRQKSRRRECPRDFKRDQTSSGVQNPFRSTRADKPFLSPLRQRRTVPAIAAPLALTVIGGVALVVAFGALVGVQSKPTASDAPPAVLHDAAPEAAAAAPSTNGAPAQASTGGKIDEPALVTASPEPSLAAGQAVPAIPRTTGFVPLGTTAPALPPAPAPTPERTAAIPRVVPAGVPVAASDVPVAETDDEIAALEEEQARENDDSLGEDAAGSAESAAAPPAAGMRPAIVTSAVNLRASPDNDAQVVKVLPDGADIQAEDDCGWCRASHDGVTGYVYKSFIEYR